MIIMECHSCGAQLSIDPKYSGVRGKCMTCGSVISVPVMTYEANQSDYQESVASISEPASGSLATSTQSYPLPCTVRSQNQSDHSGPIPAFIYNSLTRGECVVATFNRSWTVWISFGFWALLSALTLVLTPVAIYVFLKTIGYEHVLTSKRIIAKRGIFSLQTNELRLSKVENVTISKSLFESFFGGGTVQITGTGGSTVLLKNIRKPVLAKRMIEELLDES